LEERPILTVAGGALFVHGGVSRRASYFLREETGGVDHLNDIWKNHSTEDKINTFLDTTPEGQAIYEMLTLRGTVMTRRVRTCLGYYQRVLLD
jgi:hypothetical protein